MLEMFLRKRRIFKKRSIPEVKTIARVLVIDDRKPALVKHLEKEGWHVRYIKDLDRYENTDLLDSHIICLDINGVGQHLECESGMGLVEGIKDKYPGKRILLYSSERQHNIFDQAIDLVDARVFKDGGVYAFTSAIEELALKAFDWETCVEDIYPTFRTSHREYLVNFQDRLS